MIVDCHTQIWDPSVRVSHVQQAPMLTVDGFQADGARTLAASPVDRAIVLGFKSRYLEAEIPNRTVAEYVRRFANKMVGFAGIDPTDTSSVEEIRTAQEELKLRGVTVSPAMQDFHPCDSRAMRVYEECERRNMPILIQHSHRSAASKMEYARPYLLDEVGRCFPKLRLVIAHMGFPWIDETIALLGKHAHFYAEVSGLIDQKWTAYTALLSAYQYGVIGKLLFGSDFPFRVPAACIEALYSMNQISHGTNLPAIPREQLRGIVERDALKLLGIDDGRTARVPAATIIGDDE